MKHRIFKYAALFAIISLLTAACLSVPANAAEYNYVKDGLVALYVGNNNTGSGQNKNATVWKDLSGKGNDITDVPKNAGNYFTDTGYHLDSTKVFFGDAIVNVMNGNEFTLEMSLGDVKSKGTNWNTFMNSSNDSFSLFRLISDDTLVVKNQTDGSHANNRPKAANGLDLLKNSTITVTFKVGGKITLYVDGVQVAQEDAVNKLNCDNFFFGHDGAERCHETEYRAIRFYSKELTAAQVKANYEVDKAVLGKANTGTTSTTSTPAGTSAASSEVKNESSAAASSTPSGAASSSANNASASKAASSISSANTSVNADADGGNGSYYIYIIAAAAIVIAAVVVFVAIKNKKAKTE